MDELRIILVLIGIAVLIAVYWLSKPRKPQQAKERENKIETSETPANPLPKQGRRDDEPKAENLSLELERLSNFINRERDGEARDERRFDMQEKSEPQSAAPKEKSTGEVIPPERIVVLYVRTRDADRITGDALQAGTKKAGLEYGQMEIYHRLDEAGSREPIFSLANMTPPGTLDEAQSKTFSTPGVTMFMQLPGPLSGLDAFDGMLAAAQRLAQLWGAEVLDDSHSNLSRQRIQQLREEMREFDRRRTVRISS